MDKSNNAPTGSLLTTAVVGVATAMVVSALMDDNKRKSITKVVGNLKRHAIDGLGPVLSKAEHLTGLMGDADDDESSSKNGRKASK